MDLFIRVGVALLILVGGGLTLFSPESEPLTTLSELNSYSDGEGGRILRTPKIDLFSAQEFETIAAYSGAQSQTPHTTPANGPSCDELKPDQGFIDEMLVRVAEDGSKSYEQRVALVIGNGNYRGAIGRLDNPANDATSMANVMSALGFVVYRGIDLDADGLETCISRFTAELQSNATDIALFFYAGHGIQLVSEKDNEKRNYMMATDARIAPSGEGIGYKQIDAVLNQMRDHSEQSVFFYDACRNYPLGDQKPEIIDGAAIKRGIALISGPAAFNLDQKEADERAGIFIAYATSPNSVADDAFERGAKHSPFTKALLNNIAAPGYAMEQAMAYVKNDVGELTDWNQTPWTHSSLSKDLFLNGEISNDELKPLLNAALLELQAIWSEGKKHEVYEKALSLLPSDNNSAARESYAPILTFLSEVNAFPSARLYAQDPNDPLQDKKFRELRGIKYSADNKYILSYGRKNTALVWSASTGGVVAEIEFSHPLTDLETLPFEQIVIGVHKSGWELRKIPTGELIRTEKNRTEAPCQIEEYYREPKMFKVFCWTYRGGAPMVTEVWDASLTKILYTHPGSEIAISPDGKKIALTYVGELLELSTGRLITKLPSNEDFKFDFLANDYFFGFVKSELQVFDLQTGQQISSKNFDVSKEVASVRRNGIGDKLIVNSKIGQSYVLSLPSLKRIYSLGPREGKTLSQFYSDKYVVAGLPDVASLIFYDAENGKPISRFHMKNRRDGTLPNAMPFISPSWDYSSFTAKYSDSLAEVVDFNSVLQRGARWWLNNNAHDMNHYYEGHFFDSDLDSVLLVFHERSFEYSEEKVSIVDPRTSSVKRSFPLRKISPQKIENFRILRISEDGRTAFLRADDSIYNWNIPESRVNKILGGIQKRGNWSTYSYVTPSLNRLILMTKDNIELWDLDRIQKVGLIPYKAPTGGTQQYPITRIGRDHMLVYERLYRTGDGSFLREYENANEATLTEDGRLVAIGSEEGIEITQATDGTFVSKIDFPVYEDFERYTRMSFSNDGKQLATMSYDLRARMWNAETGELMFTTEKLRRRHSGPHFAVFSPNDRFVAIGETHHFGSTIHLYDAKTGALVQDISPLDHHLVIRNNPSQHREAMRPIFAPNNKRAYVPVRSGSYVVQWKLPTSGAEMIEEVLENLDEKTIKRISENRIRYWEVNSTVLN